MAVSSPAHSDSARVLTAFVLTGLLFMLIPGTFLGVLNLIELSSRESVSLIDPAWIQAHGHAQVFGWVGSFILGIGFYSLPRARPGANRSAAAWISWTMWTAGVTSRWVANVAGWEWRVLLPLSAALELAAFLTFVRAVSGHRPTTESRGFEPWVKIVMTGSAGFALTLLTNVYECTVLAVRGGTAAWPHAIDQRFLVLVTWGWLAPFIWGFSTKWLPALLALKPVHVGRVVAGLIVSEVGVALSLAGDIASATVLFVVAALLVTSALRLFEDAAGAPKVRGVHPTFPMFIRVAYVWLIVAAGLGVAAAAFDTSGGIWGASRHALTVGFVSVMVFSIGQRMLPAFAGGRVLWSPALMFASLLCLSIGCALRVPAEVLAYQGYATWAWRLLPVSAVVELAAVTMFAVNLIVTLLDLRELSHAEPAARTATVLVVVLALGGVAAGPGAARAFAQAAPTEPAPKPVEFGFQYRGRAEGQLGSSVTNGRDDGYYLNRLRFDLTARPTTGVTGFIQLQDARSAGYGLTTTPPTFTDIVDLRQAYLDVRQTGGSGVGVCAGRQELAFGDQRLVGALDWANTARSFDGVRVFASMPSVRIDAFVSSVVVIAPHAFDRLKSGEMLSGAYVSLNRLVSKGVVEPYVFVRQQDRVTAVSGSSGDGVSYTIGTRAAGAIPGGVDYNLEGAIQRGHAAAEVVDAWAGHAGIGWTIPQQPMKLRLAAEFSLASGDRDPRDGRDQTFDQLYPTGHNKHGLADQMGWRNMRDAMVGIDITPTPRLKMTAGIHRLALATTADGLYVAAGTEKVVNPLATSGSVGTEVDVLGTYAISRHVSASAGVAAFVAGAYLVQSTHAGTLWAPYLMWTVKY